jgi:heme exporter protein D
MSEFLAMGGYAWYVWMSYGAVTVAVIAEIAAVRARRRRAIDALRISGALAAPATRVRGIG